MSQKSPRTTTSRVSASDDLEVSTYLEIAKEKGGHEPLTHEAPHGEEEAVVVGCCG